MKATPVETRVKIIIYSNYSETGNLIGQYRVGSCIACGFTLPERLVTSHVQITLSCTRKTMRELFPCNSMRTNENKGN